MAYKLGIPFQNVVHSGTEIAKLKYGVSGRDSISISEREHMEYVGEDTLELIPADHADLGLICVLIFVSILAFLVIYEVFTSWFEKMVYFHQHSFLHGYREIINPIMDDISDVCMPHSSSQKTTDSPSHQRLIPPTIQTSETFKLEYKNTIVEMGGKAELSSGCTHYPIDEV